ncbi:MAG: hypothetical protein O3C60_15070 [Planctomycetota bacterium]|nr:hypothetical protein [Planctomycetota bacterium]
MARCEEGYLCQVCGADVEEIWDSDLYLRYVLGLVHPEQLHVLRERHIRCNPLLAQFIVDPEFPAVEVEDEHFSKAHLDPQYVHDQELLLTRAWRRLREVVPAGLPIIEYPLDEVRQRWK